MHNYYFDKKYRFRHFENAVLEAQVILSKTTSGLELITFFAPHAPPRSFHNQTNTFLPSIFRVLLMDFRNFIVVELPARTGRNPQTGAEINIPARKTPNFKAGQKLKEVCQ